MDALSALVASVSHNALASALPGKPPSSQQQFNGDTHSSLISIIQKGACWLYGSHHIASLQS